MCGREPSCIPGTISTLFIAEYELARLSLLQLHSMTIQHILPLSVVIDSAALLEQRVNMVLFFFYQCSAYVVCGQTGMDVDDNRDDESFSVHIVPAACILMIGTMVGLLQ